MIRRFRPTGTGTGERAGRYHFLQLIGEGGMGQVYLAQQDGPAGFSKVVVLKRIRPDLARDTKFVELFLNEARLAALLAHPNIVQVFELFQHGGTYYVAMEYVHGQSLRSVTRALNDRGLKVPASLAARICAEALRGLHCAHALTDRRGAPLKIVHRDVCPDNLLISYSGTTKVVDFGLAKALGVSRSEAEELHGKLQYMAPERLEGGRGDAQGDIYSMGVVLYELLTRSLPFNLKPGAASVTQLLESRPVPAREREPSIAQPLEDVLARALARNPTKRFVSAAEMAGCLESYVATCHAEGDHLDPASFMASLFGPELTNVNPGVRTQLGSRCRAPPSRRRLGGTRLLLWAGVALPLGSTVAWLSRSDVPTVSAQPTEEDAMLAREPPRADPAPEDEVLEQLPEIALRRPPEAPTSRVQAGLNVRQAGSEAAPDVKVATRRSRSSKKPPPQALTPQPQDPTAFGQVVFRAFPWAEVFLGDRSLGVTPFAALTLPAGEYTAVFRNADLGSQRKVRFVVPPNGEAIVKVNLADAATTSPGRE